MLVLPAVVLLQGCAAVWGAMALAGTVGGATVVANPDLELIPKSETDRATLAYPVATVYPTLRQTVERNGRTIVEPIDASYTLRVSYPFSLLANNWGGVITISCIAQGDATTVVFLGSGRDTNQRLQKIGDDIIRDLRAALDRQPSAH